jgi:hypothetical protein
MYRNWVIWPLVLAVAASDKAGPRQRCHCRAILFDGGTIVFACFFFSEAAIVRTGQLMVRVLVARFQPYVSSLWHHQRVSDQIKANMTFFFIPGILLLLAVPVIPIKAENWYLIFFFLF